MRKFGGVVGRTQSLGAMSHLGDFVAVGAIDFYAIGRARWRSEGMASDEGVGFASELFVEDVKNRGENGMLTDRSPVRTFQAEDEIGWADDPVANELLNFIRGIALILADVCFYTKHAIITATGVEELVPVVWRV